LSIPNDMMIPTARAVWSAVGHTIIVDSEGHQIIKPSKVTSTMRMAAWERLVPFLVDAINKASVNEDDYALAEQTTIALLAERISALAEAAGILADATLYSGDEYSVERKRVRELLAKARG
jgi:hypothetical protein